MAEFCDELEGCLDELDELDGRWPDSGATVVVAPSRRPRARAQRPARSRRAWPWLVAVLLPAAVVAAVAYLVLEGSPTDRIGGSGDGARIPVKLTGVGAYDPFGDRNEHDDEAGLAADGNPATRWTTQTYNAAGELAKPGVGLVLRLPRSEQLSLVKVSTDTPGFQARIRFGDSQGGAFEDGSATRTVNGVTNFPIRDGVQGRYVLIWITRLPPDAHVAHVNEAQAVTG